MLDFFSFSLQNIALKLGLYEYSWTTIELDITFWIFQSVTVHKHIPKNYVGHYDRNLTENNQLTFFQIAFSNFVKFRFVFYYKNFTVLSRAFCLLVITYLYSGSNTNYMEVKLRGEVLHRVEEASNIFGIKQSELVNQAILLYLDALNKQMELKKELVAWNALSDEAWNVVDKQLWKKGKSG